MTQQQADSVLCDSRKVFDGWTGEHTGWMYGSHLLGDNAPPKCPRCGVVFEKRSP